MAKADHPVRFFKTVLGFLAALLVTNIAFSAGTPDYYLYDVAPPAGVPGLMNPSSVYFEPRHKELYVADTGNNRVVIFDTNGNYLFEFSDHRHMSAPRCLAVDSLGHVLVLCERQLDRLEIFDYNGAFLREAILKGTGTDTTFSANSFAMDAGDTVYTLSELPPRIGKFLTDGTPLGQYEILKDLDAKQRSEQVLGTIAVVNGQVIVPEPIFSQLEVHDTQGKLVRAFGFPGGAPGKLSFPVSITTDGQGGYLVLDKHRHTVLQYGPDGMFIQEFGGLGMSTGWFYHPISLATDDAGHCYVLQSFMGKVQAVKVPKEKPANIQISVARPAGAADSLGIKAK